jgi:oxygen-independent coproporphyrinogen-3 oxidase
MMNTAFGLYLHIPFCRQRCHFCAFYLEVHRTGTAEAFVNALKTELRLYASDTAITGRPLHSVYFGGGTPTVLTADQLITILAVVRDSFTLQPECEITVEAHPGTVQATDLSALRQGGVTRLSFGAESMHDGELAAIGRPGASTETVAAITAARAAGFIDINVDLMYGLPGQTVESWQRTLRACSDLDPTHLSCYALTVEEGTRFAHDSHREPGLAPDESLQIQMDQVAQEMLCREGYARYEISNYAKPGYECRHNLLYWTHGQYLGLGPSAQSFVDGVRFGKVASLSAYQTAVHEGRLPVVDRIVLTRQEQLRDAVIFGLRLERGIPTFHLDEHGENYGCRHVIDGMRASKLLVEEGAFTRLSAEGRLHADSVAEKLF